MQMEPMNLSKSSNAYMDIVKRNKKDFNSSS